ncbi:MAG: hypothetical protein ACI4E1_12500 [Lachnospira sp.]
MKIEVETKFNVGDLVYIPELYHHEWFTLKRPFEIYKIIIKTYGNTVYIYYELLDEILIERKEDFVFTSYEECERWCIEQNSK